MIVESDLPNCDHFRMLAEPVHSGSHGSVELDRVVRMHAHRGGNVRMCFGNSHSGLEIGRPVARADSKHEAHPGGAGALDDLVAVGIEHRPV